MAYGFMTYGQDYSLMTYPLTAEKGAEKGSSSRPWRTVGGERPHAGNTFDNVTYTGWSKDVGANFLPVISGLHLIIIGNGFALFLEQVH